MYKVQSSVMDKSLAEIQHFNIHTIMNEQHDCTCGSEYTFFIINFMVGMAQYCTQIIHAVIETENQHHIPTHLYVRLLYYILNIVHDMLKASLQYFPIIEICLIDHTTHSSTKGSPMEVYKSYLKKTYLKQKMPDYGKWPRLPNKKFISLSVINREQLSQTEAKANVKALTYDGDVSKIMRKGDMKFADIAKPDKNGELPKFVLVEGAPGVGKSTFAWEACRKWAKGEILQDYDLLILIPLRDESVRKARCLGDLIQYPRDQTIQHKVIEMITKTGGRGVLLLLEGYDELPSSLHKEELLFSDIIKGYQFHEGTVVVTSRPWASEPFLLPHYTTKRPVSQHIEILGFTAENIGEYITSLVSEEPSLMYDIQEYLELNPLIHSMMYIPLNCAIVLEVYRYQKQENSPIPTTMTELYSSLFHSLLLRHICDLPENKGKCTGLAFEDFNKLPACIQSHFDKLAEIAYKGLLNDTQIIFTEEEIPSGLDTLGLMQSSMELYVHCAQKSFNFLHLTIQEFLAAHHLSTFPQSEQFEIMKACETSKVSMRFLAGLSPLVYEKSLSDTQSLKPEDVHKVFEAKLELTPRYFECDYSEISIDPFLCFVLGSVIAKSGCHWCVSFKGDKENIHMFVIGINSHKRDSFKLELSISSYRDKIAELVYADITLEELHITSSCAPDLNVLEMLSAEHSKLRINLLKFSLLKMNSHNTAKFQLCLQNSPSVKSLHFNYCEFNYRSGPGFALLYSNDVLPAGFNMQCFNSLHLSQNCFADWTNVYQMLKENKSPLELHVTSDYTILCEVAYNMCNNSTLRNVYLECTTNVNTTFSTSINFNEDLSKKISILIKDNKIIRELSLSSKYPDNCVSMIANSLCENCTLEILELNINMKACEAMAFASMLEVNTTLKELHLSFDKSGESHADIIGSTLSSSLAMNKTLVKLAIENIPNIDLSSVDERIIKA